MQERLLIVDDETGVVELLKSYFEMSGYTVYTACSGKDALKQAGCQPDLALSGGRTTGGISKRHPDAGGHRCNRR